MLPSPGRIQSTSSSCFRLETPVNESRSSSKLRKVLRLRPYREWLAAASVFKTFCALGPTLHLQQRESRHSDSICHCPKWRFLWAVLDRLVVGVGRTMTFLSVPNLKSSALMLSVYRLRGYGAFLPASTSFRLRSTMHGPVAVMILLSSATEPNCPTDWKRALGWALGSGLDSVVRRGHLVLKRLVTFEKLRETLRICGRIKGSRGQKRNPYFLSRDWWWLDTLPKPKAV